MSKFKHGKRLIISLLCLTLVVLASFSSMLINFHNKETGSDIEITNASVTDYSTLDSSEIYDFSRGRFKNKRADNYKNYQYFSISNYEELLEFSISVANGCDFIGTDSILATRKTIFLTNDIDAAAAGNKKNANWQPIGSSMYGTQYKGADPFCGIFDGCSYTIKNLTCKVDDLSNNSGAPRLGFVSVGAGCTIKNLRLQNTRYIIAKGGESVVGLIGEGASRMEILNCIISGLKVEITSSSSNAPHYICGFLGCMGAYTYLKVTNCILKDIQVDYPETNKYVKIYKYGPAYEEATLLDRFGDLSQRLNEFMLLEGFEKIDRWTSVVTNVMLDVNTDIFTADYFMKQEHENSADYYSDNCYDTKNTAKAGLSSHIEWYVPPTDEFNKGWPYLSSFVEFESYSFITSENGSVFVEGETNTVEVPIGVNVSIFENNSEIVIYGTKVTAQPDPNYVFSFWTNVSESDKKIYKAVFSQEFYKIRFVVEDERGMILGEEDGVVNDYSYIFACGTSLKGFTYSNNGDVYVGGYWVCYTPLKYVLQKVLIQEKEYFNEDEIIIPDLGENMSEHFVVLKVGLKSYSVVVK